ncbi:hypothetical protein [Roseomonas chloroacetimidivorans]|uniref:hypothetical protein n=1 Tax=Roseomonas chloroacetimidivorans TaxID=1766656 RepID=UPI003C7911F8
MIDPQMGSPDRRPGTRRFSLPEPSIGRESYMHRAAKEVVAGWLRDVAAEAGYDEYTRLGPLSWRVNRPGPSWGIWLEYPFTDARGGSEVWDEEFGDTGDCPWQDALPPIVDGKVLGERVAAVADIAIQHKGCIIWAVEIVHKHPCPIHKRAFYDHHHIGLIEVRASWVMRQTKRPDGLMARAGRIRTVMPGTPFRVMKKGDL